ncbi:MAG: response regulator [Eisenbergiella sp.]
MPQMTGVELLKECQAMEVKTQVIFISGFQDFEYAKAALQYGAVDYLLKPVIREELLGAVEKCVSSIRREEPWAEEAVAEEEKEADYAEAGTGGGYGLSSGFCGCALPEGGKCPDAQAGAFFPISFLEEYLEAENLGITFVKNNHIVLVLKGIERAQAKETVSGIWKEACRATGHTAVFIIGKEAYGMGEIPAAFGECLKLQSYLFFADKMQIPILSVQEPVYSQKGDPDALGEAREKVLNAIIGQDETGFENSFARYSRLLLLTADGKKEDACFYYCSAIRLAEEKMAVMGLPSRNPEMKELLEKEGL